MKYQDSNNARTNKYKKYKLTDYEKEIILTARQNRIDYLSGSILMLKDYPDTSGQLTKLHEQLGETERIKEIFQK